MSTLLPPIVMGPVSVLSTLVRIDGPLPGSNVILIVNGVAAPPVAAGSDNTTYVAVAHGLLASGDALTARWSMAGQTSDDSPVAVSVLGLPDSLSPLVYLSQLHTCVDWLYLGGAYPGATIEVLNGSVVVGHTTAKGKNVSVRIGKPINANDVLSAVQSVVAASGTVKSSPTPSLPAEPAPYREAAMPAPSVGAVAGCANAVPILSIAQGATVELKYNGDVLQYPFVGPGIKALLGRAAHKPDTFSAAQRFERCRASSPFSIPDVVVDDTRPIVKPMIGIGQYLCPAAQMLPLTNLESGAVLTIELVQPSGAVTELGHIGVGEDVTTAQFWIPDLATLIPATPPNAKLVVTQQHCGRSATSDPLWVGGTYQGSMFPPTIMDPVVECMGGVFVNDVDGAVVRIYSDAQDSPIISLPVFNLSGAVWIDITRPLRAGEHIHAELELTCQPPALRVGQPVKVADLQALKAPGFQQPVRTFHRTVYLTGTVPGALVHVFVNGKWRVSGVSKNLTSLFFPLQVGELHLEDQLTAMQAMCTKMSPATLPAVNVSPGSMLLEGPSSLTAGVPVTVTIKAMDADNKTQPVAATVSQGGAVVGATNAPFTLSPPAGASSVSLQVAAAGYSTQTIAIALTAPAVAKTAVLSLTTNLWFNASKKVITEITWKLVGSAGSFSKTEKPNANPAQVQFSLPNPPGGGYTPYALSCSVKFDVVNLNFVAGVSGPGSAQDIVGGLIKPTPSTVEMHWYGTDMTLNFLVDWDQANNFFFVLSV